MPPRTVWKPNPTGWLLIGWGSWSQRAPRVAPRDKVGIPPHPGRIGSHPWMRYPSISTTHNKWGTKTETLRVNTAPHGVKTLTPLANC